ncbi:MAG: hypothetical protein U0797_05550 [Gemmataceae bacterium]
MPLRLPCKPAAVTPRNLLYPYWGATGFHRPVVDVYLVGPNDRIAVAAAQIDTGADHTIFASTVAQDLGLTLPFPRQSGISGAGGTYTATVSFPPDGLVSLFVTDYREYCYLPNPLIGFHAPGTGQRSVLGLSGFLQGFRFTLDPSPPAIELDPATTFVGATGAVPAGRGLYEFILSLRKTP